MLEDKLNKKLNKIKFQIPSEERTHNRLIYRKTELPGKMQRLNAARFGSFCKSSHKYRSLGASGHVKAGIIELLFESISKYPLDAVWRHTAKLGMAAGKSSQSVEK